MIVIESRGNFDRTDRFLMKLRGLNLKAVLESFGAEGTAALMAATPVKTGTTARSWYHEVSLDKNGWVITWNNSNVNHGVPIAVILQYGHGTGTGGYVQGRDYINPALRPVFDKIAAKAWKEVTDANR